MRCFPRVRVTDAPRSGPARQAALATAATLGVVVILFASGLGGPGFERFTYQLVAGPSMLVAAMLTWLAGRRLPGPRRARLAWSLMAAAFALNALGSIAAAPDFLANPSRSPGEPPPVMIASSLVAVAIVMVALLIIPVTRPRPGDRMRMGFDIATVVLGALAFLWYYLLSPALAANPTPINLVLQLLSTIGATLVVFAVMRLAVIGAVGFSRRSLLLFAAAAAAEVSHEVLFPVAIGTAREGMVWALAVTTRLLIVAAAFAQTQNNAAADRRSADRRRLSPFPYGAIAATQLLLITACYKAGIDVRTTTVAVAGSALTVLVVVRQVAAFRENQRLLDTVTTSLSAVREAAERERVLATLGADLIRLRSVDDIERVTKEAVRQLLGAVPDATATLRLSEELRSPHRLDVPGSTSFPLMVNGQPCGLIEVHTPTALPPGIVQALETLANSVTLGLEAIRLTDQLTHQAQHDPLTGLANRALLHTRTDEALRNEGTPVFLLMIDLDGFKAVNDTFGHQAGDALLTALARRLSAAVVPPDLVARIGGDEFAVLLRTASTIAEAQAVADALERLIEGPVPFRNVQLRVGGSIGIAGSVEAGANAGRLLQIADETMYEIKRCRHAARGGRARSGATEPPTRTAAAARVS